MSASLLLVSRNGEGTARLRGVRRKKGDACVLVLTNTRTRVRVPFPPFERENIRRGAHSDLVGGFVFLRHRQLPHGADHSHGFAVILRAGEGAVRAVLVAVLRQLLLFLPIFVAVAVLGSAAPERLPFVSFRRLVELEQLRQHVVGGGHDLNGREMEEIGTGVKIQSHLFISYFQRGWRYLSLEPCLLGGASPHPEV